MSSNIFQDSDALLRILSTYSTSQNHQTSSNGVSGTGQEHGNSGFQSATAWLQDQSKQEQRWNGVREGAHFGVANSQQPYMNMNNIGHSLQQQSSTPGNQYQQLQQTSILPHQYQQYQQQYHQQIYPTQQSHFTMPSDADDSPKSNPNIASAHATRATTPTPQPATHTPVADEEPLPDVRTIVDWPSGLRYITRWATKNSGLGPRIKKEGYTRRLALLTLSNPFAAYREPA